MQHPVEAYFKGSLGDCVCLLPVLEALSRKRQARIAVGGPNMAGLLKNNPFATHCESLRAPLTFRHPEASETCEHLIDVYARLAGVTLEDRAPRVYLDEADAFDISAALPEPARGKPLVAMDPQAGWPNREWGAAKFEELARILQTAGLAVVQVGKPFTNCYGDAVDIRLQGLDASFHGTVSLRQTAHLLSRCACYVGNDSGLAHLSAAVRTPAVCIFGPVNPRFRAHSWTLPVFHDACPRWRESHSHCSQGGRCMRAIHPPEVAELVLFAVKQPDKVPNASARMLRRMGG